ncbi:SH3 domain-containing protein [Methylocystis sp. MJC1]|jgi:uncharacterized protein YraI|uniref:SH3 domain-containing protein n=1 Tax=Methylocystis sp. MJC1 TaxID=2654282 RepID=UPI0013EB1100|nr:SH3 domain-containing protein [Methylocystis sp. MJC1]KAF2992840.1 hypothetical protein MJC1_00421 [Methylocystis sp. MJC1]MBU6526799.1 hypothetical protein [Methylocystis sp. MJC1]UZX13233.1 SH3 domain-containing protein [Methylocystis sp. MJC1]
MRSKFTPVFVAVGLAASVGWAVAAPAIVSADTALRARPGMRSAILATIPAGAAVEAGPCRAWCRVQYGPAVGFVPSPLLVAGTGAAGYYGSAGYGDAGPFGLLAAPFEAAGDIFGGPAAYGQAGPMQPPVVAGY